MTLDGATLPNSMLDSLKTVLHAGKMPECFGVVKSTSRFFRRPPSVNSPESCRKVSRPPEVSVPPEKQRLLASKRCFSGGTDTSGGLETLRQLSGLLTDGGRRKKRDVDFTTPKHIGIRARVEYGFQRIKHRIGERGAIQRRQPR